MVFADILGKTNRHTVNGNTSGVITLIELMEALSPQERVQLAFVVFDNEENGLLGLAQFYGRHKAEMEDKLLINFDRVSDGDDILLILNQAARKRYENQFAVAFAGGENKRVRIVRAWSTLYPSDQMNFPINVDVAAFRRQTGMGLYLSRIYNARDTVLDEENIRVIAEGMVRMLRGIPQRGAERKNAEDGKGEDQ